MSAIDTLRGALGDSNVQAFARVVRQGESHVSSPLAYQALFGWHPVKNPGRVFTDFADHPRQAFQTKWGWTSAAGAYQAMCAVPGKVKTDTWGDFVRWCAREGYWPSFSPTDQDLFFAWCVQRRKALDDVIAGRFGDAIDKCNEEWASLPGAPYGQPVMTMDEARKTFITWGGVIREGHVPPRPMPPPAPPAPAPQPDVPIPQPEERPMVPPLIFAGISATLAALFPKTPAGQIAAQVAAGFTPLAQEKIERELNRHTDNPAVAQQMTDAIISAIKTSTGQGDTLQAAATATADPAGPAVKAAETAALDVLDRLMPALTKAREWERQQQQDNEASRDAASRRQNRQDVFLTRSIVWMMAALLASLVAGYVLLTIYGKPSGQIEGALILLIGMVGAEFKSRYQFAYGSSDGSRSKDAVVDAAVDALRRK